jgi:hypothetical protein
MNVVIDEAAEVYVKDAKPRRELGALSKDYLSLPCLCFLQAVSC